MRRADMFPSKYLVANDIPKEGMDVTILHVEEEKMRDGKPKPVIFFDELEKGMVCNVTNWKAIAALHGDESDDWAGQRITLYPSVTTFDEEEVDCIRIKKKIPKPTVVATKRGKRSTPAETAAALKEAPAVPREPGDDDDAGDGADDIPY